MATHLAVLVVNGLLWALAGETLAWEAVAADEGEGKQKCSPAERALEEKEKVAAILGARRQLESHTSGGSLARSSFASCAENGFTRIGATRHKVSVRRLLCENRAAHAAANYRQGCRDAIP